MMGMVLVLCILADISSRSISQHTDVFYALPMVNAHV